MWSVFFVFLSYLDRNVVKGDFLSRALDAEKESKETFSMLNGTVCAKMSIVGENFLYQVSDGAEVVRSVVTPAGKLVNCSVIVNQMQVKSFVQECRLGLQEQRVGRQLETRFARMDEAKLMCRELRERSGAAEKEQVLKRSKRGFTYPGTLWCGAGNMADNYNQLDFADTDSCCRTHDHCPHVIHAFSSKYGHTNFKWHSICHCDCDNLKACLRKVNDTSSRVVGQAFFNVIGVPCFEFVYEEQCAERHWYGCKRYEKLPIAVLKDSVPYDFGGIDVIDELTLAPPRARDSKKSNKEEKPESATQSTISGPEEPSLRNVVTAAEDFIKVLATVSTSQSSTAESERGEAQSSEKKKRKKKKKITKKRKGKGKGKKRKQKAEAGVKIEEGAAVSPSGSRSEEVKALGNFISESHRHDQSSRNTNRVGDGEFELVGKDEPSNEVM
uniref:Protein interacting with cyclin A1 n=1 Tax=Stegastes partitus TaxID=144197 RepID=A0A3B5AQF1_9TELE